jgi:hypothetical protein
MMAKVTDIGGFFFKSTDPKKLTDWYHEHLGVPVDDYGYVTFPNPDVSENDKSPQQFGVLSKKTHNTLSLVIMLT